MKLNQYENLDSIIRNIPYLTENETTDFIDSLYLFIKSNYGERVVSTLIDNVTEPANIGKIISYRYADYWKRLKNAVNNDESLTGHVDKETIENYIYGYNSTDGVEDYKNVKTHEYSYPNLYDNFNNALAFYRGNVYYTIIGMNIAHDLTLPIYESEV